jgi:hypothetical protein
MVPRMPSSNPPHQLSLPWDITPAHSSHGGNDGELQQVRTWLLERDPDGARFARLLRESLDQVLDGPRTGRFRYADLRKTEKTHVGTVVEINVGKEFDLPDGEAMDYRIAGVEVDCKYSMSWGGWQLPRESMHHLVLLTWADDDASRWSAGLWRVQPDKLNQGKNLDSKKTMTAASRQEITWLWREHVLDENLLLHLDPATVAAILAPATGQQRINTLFRLVRQRIVRREVVLTVARQKDGPRRARTARETRHLGKEGIIVLGHYEWDLAVARVLDLPGPRSGEWISTRVHPARPDSARATFTVDHERWAIAEPDEPIVQAPTIPRSRSLDPDL